MGDKMDMARRNRERNTKSKQAITAKTGDACNCPYRLTVSEVQERARAERQSFSFALVRLAERELRRQPSL